MRKDLDGEARGFRAEEECAIGVVPRRVKVCAARGEEARWSGSGEDEPEREDMEGVFVALSSRPFTLEGFGLFLLLFPRSRGCRSSWWRVAKMLSWYIVCAYGFPDIMQ